MDAQFSYYESLINYPELALTLLCIVGIFVFGTAVWQQKKQVANPEMKN